MFHGLHVRLNLNFYLNNLNFNNPFVAAAFVFIGKKYLMVCLAVPFIAGWLMLFLAKNALLLLIGRFLTGIEHQRNYFIYLLNL